MFIFFWVLLRKILLLKLNATSVLGRFCFYFHFGSACSKGFQYHPYLCVFVRQNRSTRLTFAVRQTKKREKLFMESEIVVAAAALIRVDFFCSLPSRFCVVQQKSAQKNINFLINMPQIRQFF